MLWIYASDSLWESDFFRFELLQELANLESTTAYVTPLRIKDYLSYRFGRRSRGIGTSRVTLYAPYLRISKRMKASEVRSLARAVERLPDAHGQTVFLSEDFHKCLAMKEYFGPDITVVYDMFDRYSEYGSVSDRKHFEEQERAALSTCDLILCASRTLLADTLTVNSAAVWFPNGVPKSSIVSPAPKKSPGRTIGMLSDYLSRVDTELLLEIARQLPDYTFELIGNNDLRNAGGYPSNIHFTGYLPHRTLLEYISRWDFGMALYKDNRFNYYCCPRKYFEYSARNLPIITTGIPEAKVFSELYPEIVHCVGTAEQFVFRIREIRQRMSHTDFTRLAADHTWEHSARLLASQFRMAS